MSRTFCKERCVLPHQEGRSEIEFARLQLLRPKQAEAVNLPEGSDFRQNVFSQAPICSSVKLRAIQTCRRDSP